MRSFKPIGSEKSRYHARGRSHCRFVRQGQSRGSLKTARSLSSLIS